MKILFVCDFHPSFYRGGAELSTFWQAKQLTKRGIKVTVLAPKNRKKTSPIFFINPIFILYQIIQIIRLAKRENFNLIHCQGKYSVPAAVLAKYLLKKPLVITLRDYGGLCNHAFCLWENKKKCNLISFWIKDFWFYYKHYLRVKNIFSFIKQLLFSYWGRINTLILSFFMKKADKFICVSDFIKNIYCINGYDKNKMFTVYNIYPIKIKKEAKFPKKITLLLRKFKYRVIYAGKLSLGKGADLLIKSAQKITKSKKDILFIFAGKILYPIRALESAQLLFLNKIDNQQLLKIMSKADLICIPSVWPEPLSRVTIEAFELSKPVLSSNVGGQAELVNKNNGWLFEPSYLNLQNILDKVLTEENTWRKKGENGRKQILRLEKETITKLIKLYNSLL